MPWLIGLNDTDDEYFPKRMRGPVKCDIYTVVKWK